MTVSYLNRPIISWLFGLRRGGKLSNRIKKGVTLQPIQRHEGGARVGAVKEVC